MNIAKGFRLLAIRFFLPAALLACHATGAAEPPTHSAELRISVFPRVGLFDPLYFRSTYVMVERSKVQSINFMPVRADVWRPWSEAEYVSALPEQIQREFRELGAWELMTSEYLHENGSAGFEPYRRRLFLVSFKPRSGEKATHCVLRMTPPSGQTLLYPADPECRLNYQYSIDVNAAVQLELEYQSDKHGLSRVKETLPEDFLLVSLGDSFASGEGNPDVPLTAMHGLPTGLTPPAGQNVPVWMDIRCHRSAWAGAIRAGLRIAAERKAVTILSLACSGAKVETGIRSQSDGVRPATEYISSLLPAGVSPPPMSALTRNVLGQLEVLRKFLDGQQGGSDDKRSIDALVISSGGNDVHFGDIVTDIVTKGTSPAEREALRAGVESGLSRLRSEVYRGLAQELAGFQIGEPSTTRVPRQIRHLLITEYPDPTRKVAKPTRPEDFCDGSADSILGIPVARLTAEEAQWAFENVVTKLGPIVRSHAEELGALHVGDITERYVGRGWCAASTTSDPYAESARWMRTHRESQKFQGSKHGTLHPSWQGQEHYAYRIHSEIRRGLSERIEPTLELGKDRRRTERFIPPSIDILPYINGKPAPGQHPWCITNSIRDGCTPTTEPQPINYLHGQTASLHVRITHRDTRRVWGKYLGTFTVDALPPKLRQCSAGTVDCGRGSWTRMGEGVKVVVDDEDGSGVAWTKATLEKPADDAPEARLVLEATQTEPNRIFSTPRLTDGEWRLTVASADRVGNVAANLSPEATILVDESPPKIVDLTIAGANHMDVALQTATPVLEGHRVEVSVKIRDEHSGSRTIELRLGTPGGPMDVENEKTTGNDACPRDGVKDFIALFTTTPFSASDSTPVLDLGITALDCVGNATSPNRLRMLRVKPHSEKPLSASAWLSRLSVGDADWRAASSISPRFSGTRAPETEQVWTLLAAYLNLASGRTSISAKVPRTLDATCLWINREGSVWSLITRFEACASNLPAPDLAAWWSTMEDALASAGIVPRAVRN